MQRFWLSRYVYTLHTDHQLVKSGPTANACACNMQVAWRGVGVARHRHVLLPALLSTSA